MPAKAYRKTSRPSPAYLQSLVFGLALLLGAGTVSAQIRTVLVSPVPGDPVASGTALRNALNGISSPSSSNRWLLKIEPGIYDVGTVSLVMRPFVDIEGSGMGVTTIRGSAVDFNGTIHGASSAELRLLTVEAAGNASSVPGPIAMANYQGASPRLYRVKFSTTGTAPTAWGIRNSNSTPLIEECEIIVNSTGTNSSAYGLMFRNDPRSGGCELPAGRTSILRTKIAVSGPGTNHGLAMAGGQFVSEIRDSRMDVNGGNTTYGIYAWKDSASCDWLGSEALQIKNTEILTSGGSSASYGVKIESGVVPPVRLSFDIVGGRVWGSNYGIVQGGPNPIGIQGSSVLGFTKTVETAGNISIATTLLYGGPATAQGWIGCMGVWDENAIFYAQGACP
jgi:hypothetical protein